VINAIEHQGETVIIFGANGFLGSVTTKRLVNSGYDVVAVVRPGADFARLEGLESLRVLEVEPKEWPQIVTEYSPSAVICSHWNGVAKQDRSNLELQKTNIEPLIDIANSAKDSLVGTFICFGSQAEAKESAESILETFYDSGETAYGAIKSELHSNLASLFEGSDCRFIWARIFSIYGPSDYSDSLLMRLFESEISQSELVISNPSRFWSYLYEDDFASAIDQILRNSEALGTVNVGSPVLSEIKEIVAIWQGQPLTNQRVYESNEANSGYFPLVEKLRSIGWSPSISLDEGIRRTRKAFSDRLNPK
jgi:UDP-glucose 4-epimerase